METKGQLCSFCNLKKFLLRQYYIDYICEFPYIHFIENVKIERLTNYLRHVIWIHNSFYFFRKSVPSPRCISIRRDFWTQFRPSKFIFPPLSLEITGRDYSGRWCNVSTLCTWNCRRRPDSRSSNRTEWKSHPE